MAHLSLPLAAADVPAYLGPTAALVIAAAVIGYLSVRARVVSIVGFLLAGVLIGPAQLGLVQNNEAVRAAADVGVILLLFTIGIEFSLDRLTRVLRWVVLGGGTQVTLATVFVLGLVLALGGDWRAGLFTGFLVALSSTAIVLKLNADTGETHTVRGRLSLSVLIFQDLAVVVMVLLVPLLATGGAEGGPALGRALAVAGAVLVVVLVVARKVMPPLLERVAALCSQEVFLLTVVAICLGTAYATALAGVSVSLGAFLAGLVVSESRHSVHAFSEILPLQIIFSAVFFISVGMLLDIGFVLANLPLVLGTALLVLLVKAVTTTLALLPARVGWREAAATALLLGQIGEFSFVLAGVGATAGLTPAGLGQVGSQVFVATTVLLMVATPLLAAAGRRLTTGRADVTVAPAQVEAPESLPGSDHVVLLGWGEGSVLLGRTLQGHGVDVVLTTLNPEGAAAAEAAGIPTLRGSSVSQHVLREAHVERARLVVVAEDMPEQVTHVVSVLRNLTTAPIVVRPQGRADLEALAEAGADHVVDKDRASDWRLLQVALDLLSIPSTATPPPGTTDRTWVDTSRLVHFPWPGDTGCPHGAATVPVLPRTPGCVACLRAGLEWVHLRLCLTCGYVGCCDSSPGRHARAHHLETGHPLVASVEPDETWAYCFLDGTSVAAPAT